MLDTGHDVFGATVLGPSPSRALIGDPCRTESNMRLWSEAAVQKGFAGVVVTRWAANTSLDRARGPASLRDLALMQSAQLAWNGALSSEEIEHRYDSLFGGARVTRLLRVMALSFNESFFNWADAIFHEFSTLSDAIPPESRRQFEKYKIALDCEFTLRRVKSLIANGNGSLTIPDDYSIALEKKFNSLRKDLQEYFSDELPEDSLLEWQDRLLGYYEAMFYGLNHFIKHTGAVMS